MIGGLLAILIWSTKQAHNRVKFQLEQFYERCKDLNSDSDDVFLSLEKPD